MGSRSRVGGTGSAPTVIRSVRPAPQESSMTPLLAPGTPRHPARTTSSSVVFLGAPLPLSIALARQPRSRRGSVGAPASRHLSRAVARAQPVPRRPGPPPGLATRSLHDRCVGWASRRRVAGGTRTTVRTGPSLDLPPAPTQHPPREGAGKVRSRRCSHEPHTEARSISSATWSSSAP